MMKSWIMSFSSVYVGKSVKPSDPAFLYIVVYLNS
jgi:hypothetical protein